MTEKDKMQYIHYMQLKEELDNVTYNGVMLKMDGNTSNSHTIASMCVFREDNDYMRDYIRDEKGCVAEINFDSFERM